MSGITLTASQQDTLAALHDSSALAARTTERLNSGKKVNGVADDAVAYFRSQGLSDRASALTTVKANIGQSVQSVQAALDATSAVEGLLERLKGVLEGARGATLSQRVSATVQFKSIGLQLAQLVKDASYQGLNLLTSSSTSLTTQFSERTAATLTIPGYDLVATGAGTSRSLFTQAAVFNSAGNLIFSALVNENGVGVGGGTGAVASAVVASGSAVAPVYELFQTSLPVLVSQIGNPNIDQTAYFDLPAFLSLVRGIPYGNNLGSNTEIYAKEFSQSSYEDLGTVSHIINASYKTADYTVTSGLGITANNLNTPIFALYVTQASSPPNQVTTAHAEPTAAAGGFSALNILGGASTGGDANTTLPASVVAAIYTQTDNRLDAAISQIQAITGSLGINVDILKARTSFTSSYSTTLQQASDKLTLADLNEEAASSQALELRQQIGIQSLSVRGQQNASILDLLR